MALPKLNDQPKFEITVPSTKEIHRFRPFLVKEEKVLLIALESNDQRQMLNAIADTVDACSNGSVRVNELTTYDIEYLFTQLRGKSVGETTKLQMICKECENTTEAVINLDDINTKFNDYVGSITRNEICDGHDLSYYLDRRKIGRLDDDTLLSDSMIKESFAEYVSTMKHPDPIVRKVERKLMEHYAPNTTKAYDTLISRLDKLYD